MNILLPYPSFAHSVAALAMPQLQQLCIASARTLTLLAHRYYSTPEPVWAEASLRRWAAMWTDHDDALAVLYTMAHHEWTGRGYGGLPCLPYAATWERNGGWPGTHIGQHARAAVAPAWVGREELHASHRAMLLYLNTPAYTQMGWQEQPATELWWPNKD